MKLKDILQEIKINKPGRTVYALCDTHGMYTELFVVNNSDIIYDIETAANIPEDVENREDVGYTMEDRGLSFIKSKVNGKVYEEFYLDKKAI